MGIELEPLHLEAIQIMGQPGGLHVQLACGTAIAVPPQFEFYLLSAKRGLSLHQICQEILRSGQSVVFQEPVSFIHWLCECRLVRNQSAYRFIEETRPDYQWPRSLFHEPLFELGFISLSSRTKNSGMHKFGLIASSLLILVGGARWVQSGAGLSGTHALSLFPMLVLGYITLACSRLFRSLLQIFLVRSLTGEAMPLKLSIDGLGVRLLSKDWSDFQMQTGKLLWTITLAGLTSLFTPFIFLAHGRDFLTITVFVMLGLFLDFTPFTRSELTESLRHYFNQWLIEPIATRGRFNARKKTAGNAPPEAIIGQILVQAKAAWVVLFLTFTALWLLPYLGRIKHLALNPAAKITVLGFGAFLLFCLADDIYSGLMGADDPFHIRRLWRKRPRGKRSEAARKTIEDFQDRTSFLELPLLRQLEPGMRDQLLKGARVIEAQAGQMICRQGEKTRELFIMLSGRAVVQKRSNNGNVRAVALLEQDAVFGESGFFFGLPRTANVVTLEDSLLLCIRHREEYNNLHEYRTTELAHRIWFLQALLANGTFQNLPGDVLDQLIFLGSVKKFSSGVCLINEGELGSQCYFIIQGQFEVVQNGRVINSLGNGDLMGEIALLRRNTVRTATVRSLTDCLVVEVTSQQFWDFLSRHLILALEVSRLGADRLSNDRAREGQEWRQQPLAR